MKQHTVSRSKAVYLPLLFGVIVLGLGTRIDGAPIPEIVSEYGGDVLWAIMVYMGLCTVQPKGHWGILFGSTLGIAYSIEVTQLYHAPWIDMMRNTTLGGLILGFHFIWSDIVCYSIGGVLGLSIDYLVRRTLDKGNSR